MRKGDKVRVTVGMAEGMEGVVNYVRDSNEINVSLKGDSYSTHYRESELELVKQPASYIVITGLYLPSFHGPFYSEQSAKAWADEAGKGAYEIATLNEPVES